MLCIMRYQEGLALVRRLTPTINTPVVDTSIAKLITRTVVYTPHDSCVVLVSTAYTDSGNLNTQHSSLLMQVCVVTIDISRIS